MSASVSWLQPYGGQHMDRMRREAVRHHHHPSHQIHDPARPRLIKEPTSLAAPSYPEPEGRQRYQTRIARSATARALRRATVPSDVTGVVLGDRKSVV